MKGANGAGLANSERRRDSLLVIDDDDALCDMLAQLFGAEGFDVACAQSASEGVEAALSGQHRLVILDVMLPGGSGFDVLRQIRRTADVPVVMLTARTDDVDRIVGLELGADDYLTKPFPPRELIARVRGILRRVATAQPGNDDVARIRVGDVEMDFARRHVRCAGQPVILTGIEFDLLKALLGAAGHVVSREEISRTVFQRTLHASDQSLNVHVSSLRRKLGDDPNGEDRIKTVRGVGYIYLRPTDGA